MRVPKQINSPKASVWCYTMSIDRKVRVNIEVVRTERFDNKENVLRPDEIRTKNEPELEKSLKFEKDPGAGCSVCSSEENSNQIEPAPEIGLEIGSLPGSSKLSENIIPEIEKNLNTASKFLGKTSEKDFIPESEVKSSSILKVSSVLRKTVSDIQKSPKPKLKKTQNLSSFFIEPHSPGLGTDLNIVEVLSEEEEEEEEELENSNHNPCSSTKENKSEELYSFGSSSQSSEHLQNSYFLC